LALGFNDCESVKATKGLLARYATIWIDGAVQTVYDLFPNFPDLFLALRLVSVSNGPRSGITPPIPNRLRQSVPDKQTADAFKNIRFEGMSFGGLGKKGCEQTELAPGWIGCSSGH
jgi:hypothetical protein